MDFPRITNFLKWIFSQKLFIFHALDSTLCEPKVYINQKSIARVNVTCHHHWTPALTILITAYSKPLGKSLFHRLDTPNREVCVLVGCPVIMQEIDFRDTRLCPRAAPRSNCAAGALYGRYIRSCGSCCRLALFSIIYFRGEPGGEACVLFYMPAWIKWEENWAIPRWCCYLLAWRKCNAMFELCSLPFCSEGLGFLWNF